MTEHEVRLTFLTITLQYLTWSTLCHSPLLLVPTTTPKKRGTRILDRCIKVFVLYLFLLVSFTEIRIDRK